MRPLLAHAPRQHKQFCKRRFEPAVTLDVAADIADDAAESICQILVLRSLICTIMAGSTSRAICRIARLLVFQQRHELRQPLDTLRR